ncbi:site-specific integrase [Chromohalobacter sp. 296-RDG]|uniref:tyrosine-type recombinase/integrase n=1 Tax=Chromohalobacter sp. 296-RDG TaxID=2994062 RepID=UPI002469488A|nr:site-specific integrase [Chromohalobacter sp. 296-RDG]
MPKVARDLTNVEIKRLEKPGFHNVGHVPGLILQIGKNGSRSWVLRIRIGDKRRDIGLGSAQGMTLSQAKTYAAEIRRKVRDEGIDPVAERKAARSALLAQQAKAITFRECAEEVIKNKQGEFTNKKHSKQWRSTLEQYAYPIIGELSVDDIELAHVKQVLKPHWKSRTETMTRVRQRIEAVINYAITSEYRQRSNPAIWKGNLENVLSSPNKITKVVHHRALEIDAMHAFMTDLRQRQGNAARCLEFVVLTAARSGEARGATWSEIDLEKQLWIIPGERMKAGKEHRVPLSDAAVKLLKAQPQGDGLVFPAPRGGKLSDAAMSALLRRMEIKATVHGMRSSFRDWAAERTSTPNQIAEMALAHTVQGVEGAYRRGDLIAKRAKLMDQWAEFIDTKPGQGENVTAIRAKENL